MERQVSRPIEESVNTVQGIYEVTSTSNRETQSASSSTSAPM